MAREITYNNFKISLVVFMPNITTNHAITYTNFLTLFLTLTSSFLTSQPLEGFIPRELISGAEKVLQNKLFIAVLIKVHFAFTGF